MVAGAKNTKKGPKKKEKLVFAKDKNQAILALVVLLLFIANTIFMTIKGYMEQHPSENTQTATTAAGQTGQPTDPSKINAADEMAQRQQQNLESLAGSNTNSPAGADNQNLSQDANNIYSQTMNMKGGKNPNVQAPESEVDIMARKTVHRRGKMVMISVADSGRSNPFLPAGENFVPSAKLPYLPAPPENLQTNSDAGKVMTTTISGILYDKYSPSAIINIEGSDYLVKRGDIINHYRILSIGKTEVIVQLGRNIYQAGVGELLTKTDLNFNTIANLNKKFGGNNVSIKVKKKGY